jgi:hypothetical protein
MQNMSVPTGFEKVDEAFRLLGARLFDDILHCLKNHIPRPKNIQRTEPKGDKRD